MDKTTRLTIQEWALRIAEVTAERSEDPYRKVGAVAVDHSNRVIATAYNGLMPGYDPPEGFWDDRDKRLMYMIHAEQNLCSLVKRGEVSFVAITTQPCATCMMILLAHNIKHIYYRESYDRDDRSKQIADFYDIGLYHRPAEKYDIGLIRWNDYCKGHYPYLRFMTPRTNTLEEMNNCDSDEFLRLAKAEISSQEREDEKC